MVVPLTRNGNRCFLCDRVISPAVGLGFSACRFYTSDAADDTQCVPIGGRQETQKTVTRGLLLPVVRDRKYN